ncbi:MAG: valine--tRNA ligase [Candidatus Thermoplasmatota archaeon]|jgi:valyl-tRNA synthetase|nr:valine--tRNA ligase [Candidatus Thermoplasmatota archaeon]MDP7265565.1 valine--tRNA ligase [Candidatus Thermoplasmatota archaeon]
MTDLNLIEIEKKWQDWWEKEEIYHFDPDSDREVYSIDNPPRYASGPLHIGHAVHYTHIDFAARYHRMLGKNVMFPLCFDVNGMPIEVNVEKKYGIRMKDCDRHEFIGLCEKFAEGNIEEMTRQFKILGESMDPSVYYQTNAKYYRRLTQISFIRLFNKGLIYKDRFPVNWCPRCGTALAESEVEYQDRTTKLNYYHFTEKETGAKIPIATTRPELLCTCQMVALSPDDPRAEELRGKTLITPIYNREVPVKLDDEVDADFGTGVVMICTIGDKDDLNWVFNYGLKMEMGIDEQGNMTELAGKYQGMYLEDARKAIIEDLKSTGTIWKQEELEQNVGMCWRCSTPIEFLLSKQWFLKTLPFRLDVLKSSDEIKWFPEYMRIRLEEWVNSLSWDWVISRQRYFATPIPAWECEDCGHIDVPVEENCYIDPTIDAAPKEKCEDCGGSMRGSEEVFDTWMDSSITPLFNTFWLRDDKKFEKFFPMSLRPQSHDIIRTWAFYTILRSKLLCDSIPWKDIMMGGFILAADGSPMHASKGNVINPLKILNESGAEPLRYYATTCALGRDNAFRQQDIVRGLHITRKLYNIQQLISLAVTKGRENGAEASSITLEQVGDDLHPIDKWLLSLYSKLVEGCTEEMNRFRFDRSVRDTVYFMWHRLADHYLEIVKNRIYAGNDRALLFTLYRVGLGIIKLLAPFLVHVTEELFHNIYIDTEGDKSIHVSQWPEPILRDDEGEKKGSVVVEMTSAVRAFKSESKMPLNTPLGEVMVSIADQELIRDSIDDMLSPMVADSIKFVDKGGMEEAVVGVKSDFAKIGPHFKGDARYIFQSVKKIDPVMAWERANGDGFFVNIPGKGDVEVPGEFLVFEKAMTLSGKRVDTINIPDRDITLFVEKK